MEEQVDRLVQKTWAKYKDTPKSKRLMIAVSGIPGSGTQNTRPPTLITAEHQRR